MQVWQEDGLRAETALPDGSEVVVHWLDESGGGDEPFVPAGWQVALFRRDKQVIWTTEPVSDGSLEEAKAEALAWVEDYL